MRERHSPKVKMAVALCTALLGCGSTVTPRPGSESVRYLIEGMKETAELKSCRAVGDLSRFKYPCDIRKNAVRLQNAALVIGGDTVLATPAFLPGGIAYNCATPIPTPSAPGPEGSRR